MKNMASNWTAALLISIVVTTSLGCTMKMGMFIPNSKFAYPNSNIEPLGNVMGSASKWGFLAAPPIDQEMLDTSMNNALKQKGGDLLINMKMSAEVLMIPVIPIYRTELVVQGTAAKMTVGKQELR